MTSGSDPRRARTVEHAETRARNRDGFTLVELVVAVIILAFGLLGLAGTTAWVVRTSTMAEAQQERSVAVQSAIEQVRAQDFADVSAGTSTIGSFTVRWEIADSDPEYKTLRVISTGPGMSGGGSGIGLPSMSNNVVDTFTYQVIKP